MAVEDQPSYGARMAFADCFAASRWAAALIDVVCAIAKGVASRMRLIVGPMASGTIWMLAIEGTSRGAAAGHEALENAVTPGAKIAMADGRRRAVL